MGLFTNRPATNHVRGVPVWFMRQAGRYHAHYQNIKKSSDFMTMCRNPELACEVTLGPIEDFKFDAAILFSDLLFPLDHMGLGLSYESGPPTLERHLHTLDDVKSIKLTAPSEEFYSFQQKACSFLRIKLPETTTLLGFVGAPFTLYTYAVEGAHKGNLISSKLGLRDGRFKAFVEVLLEPLVAEMSMQAAGGAEAICLFDTAAGELDLADYAEYIVPAIAKVVSRFKEKHPDKKIVYYSKFTHLNYLEQLAGIEIDVLGVDWRHDIGEVLGRFGERYMIQGNLDPVHLFLPWEELANKWRALWERVKSSGVSPERWIVGLGHGVLPGTPEENVRRSVELIHREFLY